MPGANTAHRRRQDGFQREGRRKREKIICRASGRPGAVRCTEARGSPTGAAPRKRRQRPSWKGLSSWPRQSWESAPWCPDCRTAAFPAGRRFPSRTAGSSCPDRQDPCAGEALWWKNSRNKNARKFWVFRPKCRYSVGINRGVYTFITSFDCRKQPLFR